MSNTIETERQAAHRALAALYVDFQTPTEEVWEAAEKAARDADKASQRAFEAWYDAKTKSMEEV